MRVAARGCVCVGVCVCVRVCARLFTAVPVEVLYWTYCMEQWEEDKDAIAEHNVQDWANSCARRYLVNSNNPRTDDQ